MSLRRRVVVGFLAVAAALVITNLVLATRSRAFLLDRVDRQLNDVAARPFFRGGGPGRVGEGQRPNAGDAPTNGGTNATLTEYYLAVGDREINELVRVDSAFADTGESPPALDRDLVLDHVAERGETPEPFTAAAESGGSHWRLIALRTPFDGRVTIVGMSLDELDATLGGIRVVQGVGTLVVLLVCGLVSWWMLRLGVHPLEHMARTADAIAGGDLSQRVPHPGERTEVGRLGVALNSMLGRIEDSFRAREASEARVRRFAADASHELRTPLTSIQGYAELWRAGGLRREPELAEGMRRMEQEARRMAALVEDLLVLARLDQHRLPELARVRLDEIAADGVRDLRATDPARPVDLAAGPVEVEGDEHHLRQVVANLLANVRAHTPPSAATHVSVFARDGHGYLQVVDEGPGLSPDATDRVFERFFREDPSRARASGGTGLGLAIVAAIAEAHGGRVWAESPPGQGARFVVQLPLSRRRLEATGLSVSTEKSSAALRQLQGSSASLDPCLPSPTSPESSGADSAAPS